MSARSTERALRRDLLKKSFSCVPLGLKLLGGPIDSRSPSIFQMDIQQSPRFGEYFRIWPGARDNEVEVLSSDGSLRQLVLRVKEARRRFFQTVRKDWARLADVEARARSADGRILSETRRDWQLELWTPADERLFLCGIDDLHLFVAQVREGTTVAEVHHSLKPRPVREAESRWPGCLQRQGEWFFLPLTDEEAERLEAHLRARPSAVKTHRPVGPGGRRLHVADEVVAIDRRIRTRHRELRRPEVYARGVVIHPDHRDLPLDGWRRVVRNREIGAPAQKRLWWID